MIKYYGMGFTLLAVGLSGCQTVGPDYQAPEVVIQNQVLPEAANADLSLTPEKLLNWWENFNDPKLDALIDAAVSGNLSLQEAAARVQQARARYGITDGEDGFNLDAGAGYTKSKASDQITVDDEMDVYRVGLDASWEIDLFGGVARKKQAAWAEWLGTLAAQEQARVMVAAETALTYLQLRTNQHLLKVAEDNLGAQTETAELLESRFSAGLSDELAVYQARYNLEATRASVPVFQTQIAILLDALAVLTGQQPGAVNLGLDELAPIPAKALDQFVGIPAETLRRRPDVKMAERKLAAQSAQVGVAMSDLYPKLVLNGSIGLEAMSTHGLFSSGSDTFSIGPALNWPIFRAGTIRQNIELQKAIKDEYLISYESTLLNALKEVREALVAYRNEQLRIDALKKSVDAASQALVLAGDKYQSGLIDFSNVLDAQKAKLALEADLVRSRGERSTQLIRLYKALGGGWDQLPLPKKAE